MKRIYYSIIMCLCGIVGAAAAEPADYSLHVEDFNSLKVTDGINVDYHCSADSAGWVYFTCPPEIAKSLLFSNNKASLNIQVDFDAIGSPELPTLHVYSSTLAKVENASDSTLRVMSNVPVDKFKARVVGNGMLVIKDIKAVNAELSIATGKGHIVASGEAKQLKISNVGTGPIEAGALMAKKIKVMVLGTGPVDCYPTESLSIYGAGSGTVYYRGHPEKIVNRTIGVKDHPVE